MSIGIHAIYGAKKNAAFTVYFPLIAAGTQNFKGNPTMATGDFTVAKDGGAFVNVANAPAEQPLAGAFLQFLLTSTEMNADIVVLRAVDQTATKEWDDAGCVIYTRAVTLNDVPTAAQNAAAAWDEARSSHTTAGSFGQGAGS